MILQRFQFSRRCKAALILAVAGLLSALIMVFNVIANLPAIDVLRDVRMQVPLRVYSQDGDLIAEYGEKRRNPVSISETPTLMIQAFIAAEDDRFFEHPGVDWQGLLRAAVALALSGEKRQGGSTITMQVARNFFLTREKSYLRKINEIFLAFKIERELSKQEILELYLNKIYLGQRAYGVGAAARVYYGTPVAELNLAQYAMLAGLPKAPSTTNPVRNPEQAIRRRAYVLRRMLEQGFIERADFEQAVNAPVSASLHSPSVDLEASYAAEIVRRRMLDEYGEEAYSAGYKVTTTIRRKDQVAANQALAEGLLEYDERHGYRGPEQQYSPEDLVTEADREQLLAGYRSGNGLFPALVTAVQGYAATAWLTGIGFIELKWDGMSWARSYINENRRGGAPANVSAVLSPGDLVRVREDADGEWRLSQLPAVEGALISLNPRNGSVLALVGGFDFYRSKFNRVTQAQRQPGSSFKPFIYSAALENGYTAASLINDAPVVYDDPGLENKWRPENYSGRTFGPTRLREALRYSRNLVSIRLLHAMGVRDALRHVAKFGFDVDGLPRNLSLALGSGVITPWQLADAYSVFANGGHRVEPFLIERIETRAGELLFQANPATVCVACPDDAMTFRTSSPAPDSNGAGEDETQSAGGIDSSADRRRVAARAISPQNAWIMNELTRDVVRQGTGRQAYRALQRDDLAGKTGTTNEQRDAWFAGYNPSVVAVVWVGFDDFRPMGNGETGGRTALPVWIKYMRAALRDTPVVRSEPPVDIVNLRINRDSGCPTGAGDENAEFEVFMADHVPDAVQCRKLNIPHGDGVTPYTSSERLF